MRTIKGKGRLLSTRTGSASIAFISLILALLPVAIGVPSLLMLWQKTAKLQFQLDECTGNAALDFKRTNQAIASVNTRIKVLRAALIAETLAPELIPATRAALHLQWLQGMGYLTAWRVQQFRWIAKRCGISALALPLPGLPWEQVSADAIGPRPFRFTAQGGARYRILARAAKRKSQALIQWRQEKWDARWTRVDF